MECTVRSVPAKEDAVAATKIPWVSTQRTRVSPKKNLRKRVNVPSSEFKKFLNSFSKLLPYTAV